MFENTGSDLDEAVIHVLDILSEVADITEPRNYVFDYVADTKKIIFKLRKKNKNKSKTQEI